MVAKAITPVSFPFFDYSRYAFSLGIDTPAGVWLAGQTAVRLDRPTGRMVAEGDLVAQATVAYEKVRVVLDAVGLGLRNIVQVVEYVTPAGLERYAALARLRQNLFGDTPPALTTVVVQRLLRPDALLEVEVVASRADGERAGKLVDSDRTTGSTLHLSGLEGDPARADAGDIAGQMRDVYERAGALLAEAGYNWSNVVKTTDFLSSDGLPRYRETAAVRRELFGTRFPASTGIVMPRLATTGALVQVSVVATQRQSRPVYANAPDQRLTFAPAVQAGKVLYFAGHTALNRETGKIESPGDIVGQSRYVYETLCRLLRAAGTAGGTVVQTVEFVAPDGVDRYRETADVRRAVFREPLPAATGVICKRLLRPGALIEVDGVAVLED